MILEVLLKPLMVLACAASWANCLEALTNNDYQFAKNAAEGKVFNGYEAPEGLAPYVVRLEHGCGGSILNEHFVLSAAHCNVVDTATIIYGATNLQDSEALIAKSESFINHPEYQVRESNGIEFIQHDIAIIKVRGALDLSGRAKAIPLTSAKPPHGTSVLLVGWGVYYPGSGQAIKLQAAHMSIAACDWFPDDWVAFVCTRQKETAGPGDSGGPLAAAGELVGVVSFGNYRRGTSAYSDVSSYRNWIEDTMNKKMSLIQV